MLATGLSKQRSNGGIHLVGQLFFAGKAYLKINSLVKTPLHEFMAVERSGLWAPGSKAFSRIIFSVIFEASNNQLVNKKN